MNVITVRTQKNRINSIYCLQIHSILEIILLQGLEFAQYLDHGSLQWIKLLKRSWIAA